MDLRDAVLFGAACFVGVEIAVAPWRSFACRVARVARAAAAESLVGRAGWSKTLGRWTLPGVAPEREI